MKSIRLTKAIKAQIIENMVSELFKLREEAQEKSMVDFADEIYESMYSSEELLFMLKSPTGAFGYRTDIYVRFSGWDGKRMHFSKAMPFFYDSIGNGLNFREGDALHARHEKIQAVREQISEDRRKLIGSTKAILDSVTTLTKLLEVWPEVVVYLPPVPDGGINNLPALPVNDLNAMIAKLKADGGEI